MPPVRLARSARVVAAMLVASAWTIPAAVAEDPSTPCQDVSSSNRAARLAGTTRWETAACVSRSIFTDGADVAILARGDDAGGWADALAGTVLAAAVDAPVLLTPPNSLATATSDELERLGATQVIVLGGPAAVSSAVVDQLTDRGLAVERVSGSSRVATAVAVAQRAGATDTAFVVNGWRPADALVAGTAAARQGAALLLAEPGEVPTATLDALVDLGVGEVVIVGGTGVVPAAVEDQLIAAMGDPDAVRRVSGPTRTDTAAAIARAFPAANRIHAVAGGDANLVDAIPASWAAARVGGSVLYVDRHDIGAGTRRYVATRATSATAIDVYGGTAAIPSATLDALVAAVDAVAPTQMRGIWVHLFDDTLKSRTSITSFLDAVAAANYNTVVVQGARRHDAYYDSDVLPRTVDPSMPADLDMLGVLVPAAHARGLDVHVWYSTMPSYHSAYDGIPLPADHVRIAHGPESSDPWTTEPFSPGYAYLDPGVPGVQDHLVAMVTEVVRRYDVDGVHLDYLRYASAATGNHATSRARFNAHGNGNFDDWRRRQTQDIARRIWLEVTEIDPTVVVSMAAIAQGDGPQGSDLDKGFEATRAFFDKFQDWRSWVDEGIIDHVYPMAYFREANAEHAGWYDRWVAYSAHLARRSPTVMAVGVGAYLNTLSANVSQTQQALAATDGVVTYAWQGDSNDQPRGTLIRNLGQTLFAEPAAAPVARHKTAAGQGHALVQARDGDVVTARNADLSVVREVQADATGHAGFVGLGPGAWTFSATGVGAERVIIGDHGSVTRVDLTD